MGNAVTRQVTVPATTPLPVHRPGLSLGAGYTTFRAPAFSAPQQTSPTTLAGGGSETPPPPPPLGGTGVAPPPQANPIGYLPQSGGNSLVYYQNPSEPKTRVIFVLLGIFLGALGVHNFYAGYTKKGAMQLCVTLLTCFYGAAISWPWAIIEICIVNKDADGAQFV